MKVLELFSGTGELSAAFRARGHETYEVDWDEQFPANLHIDIGTLTTDMILEKFGMPDIVWLSPDCSSYSLAAISHHRVKNKETGNLDPISEYAKFCDTVNQHVLSVLEELRKLNPKLIFFIENPRAGLQKMSFMQPYEQYKYTICYCKYMTDRPVEQRRMKPTNIFTNHPQPKFLPPCNYGDPCHPKTPRGSRQYGVQAIKGARDRSKFPPLLINHIVDICEEYFGE